ncbi:hypothetical protein DSM3645_04635 [Blastopirellula marina DSM 3645]|uniref:Uncharacterized protein n=1 Tax=Blastopirellula marina DSM 3645 TaxID=314230 RepID=A4A1H3_9BACT|nr:hypothetical protein DSM3645_04635 [Blastopirellula marina DSM 3645]
MMRVPDSACQTLVSEESSALSPIERIVRISANEPN